jgi:hypothetical protein
MARYFIRFVESGGVQAPVALFRREMRDGVPSDATIGPGGWRLTDELPSLLRAADRVGLREVTRERAVEFEQDIIAASSQLAGPELRHWAALAGWAFIHPPAGVLFALSDMETHFRVALDGPEHVASRASRGGPFTEIIRSASLPVITWYLILQLSRGAGPRAEPLPVHPASPVSQDAQVRSARGWAVQAGWSVAYFPGGAAGDAAARTYARAADASCRHTP